jgi:hypothetical protein
MFSRSQESTPKARLYVMGQRLYCPTCGLEIEIINPSNHFTSGQILRCCGRDMTPEVGAAVHLESES